VFFISFYFEINTNICYCQSIYVHEMKDKTQGFNYMAFLFSCMYIIIHNLVIENYAFSANFLYTTAQRKLCDLPTNLDTGLLI
jgi:hypothetical protein